MKYRKKPVVIEAVQWTGENHAEMCEFIDPEVLEIKPKEGVVIRTLEGEHHASPGDYIIKGVNGEFYPCKPGIFVKTYESAALTPPNGWVSVEERLPPEHEPVLCIVNGKPKPNITLEEAYQLGSRLTAGSSMNIWTGKMLLSCGGCPFRSRRERRGEDGQERGCDHPARETGFSPEARSR